MPITNDGWTGHLVRLRGIAQDDRHTLVRFDREATPPENGPTRVGYQHWAAHRANQASSDDDVRLAIETRDEGELVGSLCTAQTQSGTTATRTSTNRFSYGIGIGSAHQRYGYALDALQVLLAAMFTDRDYDVCEVEVYVDNEPSLRLHHSLGFQEQNRGPDPESPLARAPHLVRLTLSPDEFRLRNPQRPRT